MLKSLFKTTGTFVLLTTILGTAAILGGLYGYVYATKTVLPKLHAVKVNRLTVEARVVSQQIDLAAKQLFECSYFRTKYPDNATYLMAFLFTGQLRVTYAPHFNNLFVAAAHPAGILILTDNFFMQPYEDRVQTILHEFLHFAGLPGHKLNLDRSTDLVYIVAAKCMNPDLGD